MKRSKKLQTSSSVIPSRLFMFCFSIITFLLHSSDITEGNEPPCSELRGLMKLNFCFPLSFPFFMNPSDLFGILKKDSGQARMTEKGDPVACYREYPV